MREKLGFKKRSSDDKARDPTSRQRKTFEVHESISIPGLPDYQQKSFNLTKSGKILLERFN